MGLLTDFLIARRSDAPKLAESIHPIEDWDGIEAKGLDPIKLMTLWEILAGTKPADLEMLHMASEEGPWVFEVAEDLVKLLAELEEPRAATVAENWSRTDELQLDDWATEDARLALEALTSVARKATDRKSSLLLWMCL